MAARILTICGTRRPNVVVSPALGGMIVGHETARALGVRFIFTERDADRKMALRRGFTLGPADVAAVVEDVITTGGSTREVIDIVRAAHALAIAAGSIIDRSGGAVDLGIPRVALETLTVTAYDPAQCPMCLAGEPVVKPGSRPA
jgi:orotate phosphoribosyltransferase